MMQALMVGLGLLALSQGRYPFVATFFDGCVREAMAIEQVTEKGAEVLCESKLGKEFREALIAHRRQLLTLDRISRCMEQQIAGGATIEIALTACAGTTLSPAESAHE
jgi:hypothetical protein